MAQASFEGLAFAGPMSKHSFKKRAHELRRRDWGLGTRGSTFKVQEFKVQVQVRGSG